ncbi:MAG: recombinase family protein [Clostridiales Family XIII bacterium]|nr:recombinase family protein [Clostridiales Family XIII bacterium]
MIYGVFYGRYSSHAQNDASIEQQLKECREYCEQKDITLIGEYADRAMTGTNDNRPEFQRMIKDSAKGYFQAVVCWKVDRFARNRYDAAMNKYKLKKNGVKVVYAKESIPDGPEGILLEAILEGSAEYYSANLSQNVSRGMNANAERCKVNGQLPLGYRKSANSKYEIDPVSAPVVREIFESYAGGVSTEKIAQRLNMRGIKNTRGRPFTASSFNTMLRNDRYTGTYKFGDVVIPGGIPQIISDELFERVKRKMESKKYAPAAGRKVDYQLTGKMYCGYCGKTMIGTTGTSKQGNIYHYYNCSGVRNKSGCKKKSVKKDYIEDFVVDTIRVDVLTPDNIRTIAQATETVQRAERDASGIKDIEAQIKKAEKGILNLMELIEVSGAAAEARARIEDLNDHKLDLEYKLKELDTPIITKEQIAFWLEGVRDAKMKGMSFGSTLTEIFVRKIYLYDDKIAIACRLQEGEDIEITRELVESLPLDSSGFTEISGFEADTESGELPETRKDSAFGALSSLKVGGPSGT